MFARGRHGDSCGRFSQGDAPRTRHGYRIPARTEEQRKSVGEFIEFLTSQPGATPQLEASPRSLVANAVDLNPTNSPEADSEDPLLELLRTGEALEEESFLAELHRQRTPVDVSQ